MQGVYGYDIDSEKGLVTVLGRAHPQLLVEKIRQKKKKAVVVSYEKPTPNAQTKDSSNTKEDKKNGDLDSKPKESKKKHGNGDQKGFKKEDIFGHHESDPHEFEASLCATKAICTWYMQGSLLQAPPQETRHHTSQW